MEAPWRTGSSWSGEMGRAGERIEISISSCESSSGCTGRKRGSPVAAAADMRVTRSASGRSGAEQRGELGVGCRLLAHLAPGGRLGDVARVDHAAWNGPARRRVAPANQNDPLFEFDEHVHGGTGMILRHRAPNKKGDGRMPSP